MGSELVLALAQVRCAAGDIKGNSSRIIEYAGKAQRSGADIVLFSSTCLTGYPPEDPLLMAEFARSGMVAINELASGIGDVIAVVGFAESDSISAAVINRGKVNHVYRKALFPTCGVFDEKRRSGTAGRNFVFEVAGVRVGIAICEDMWFTDDPMEEQIANADVEVILNLSALPFSRGKYEDRKKLIAARSTDRSVVLAHCNMVGAQDELVFDGGSCVHHPRLGFIARAARFREELLLCRIDLAPLVHRRPRVDVRNLEPTEEIFEALVLGLKEYVSRNGFEKVVLGLSGGVDSAVTAALAVEALGKENVICVFLPSKYTSDESRDAAGELARNLGVKYVVMPIDSVYDAYRERLACELGDHEEGVTYENLQARIRANLLMALSNQFGWLVLATGNKSEAYMGYCTLYGDTVGGFAPIKDLLKTQVYEVAEFINARAGFDVIPRFVIERPPSAELRANQFDTDSLPPYELLDPVLEAYIEEGLSAREIIERGNSRELVDTVISTVVASEYKRRQAPVGVRISPSGLFS
ncbi:MAG: NAD+ synthase [Candidatus Anoxymicrobium japonicum]|uniref:Glutamine-dependent NAD(+) synthetase n=1 Tax=Candidatus Anoxymicrobium japonicum TaxID=2013648 RepID=A0A2N3G5A0_9ACTN|nr:MAG: NAD+ synthase [Candidatus Anoxymicrobium japonicum]